MLTMQSSAMRAMTEQRPALNAANVRERITVNRQLKRGCGMDKGQRHALGGAPSRSECAMRSVAPHRAAICDPRAPPAMHSAARHVTSLCWASQEPTKLATVSQIAAPQERRGLLGSPYNVTLLGFPGAHESGDSFADRSPPWTARPPQIPVGHPSAGPLRSPRKCRQ